MEFALLQPDTFLRIMRWIGWRPDWGRASGVSVAWHRVLATDVCYRTVRQLWIEERDMDLQSNMRIIAAEARRKRRELGEGTPESSDSS